VKTIRSKERNTTVNTLVYGLIFVASPAVAVTQLLTQHKPLNLDFFFEGLGAVCGMLLIPALIAVIAAKFKGFNKLAFLIAWPICTYMTLQASGVLG
jgi:hypothetical protein